MDWITSRFVVERMMQRVNSKRSSWRGAVPSLYTRRVSTVSLVPANFRWRVFTYRRRGCASVGPAASLFSPFRLYNIHPGISSFFAPAFPFARRLSSRGRLSRQFPAKTTLPRRFGFPRRVATASSTRTATVIVDARGAIKPFVAMRADDKTPPRETELIRSAAN